MLNSWDEVRLAINELRERCARLPSASGVSRDKEAVMIRKRINELEEHFSTIRQAVDFLKTVPKVEAEIIKVDEEFSELHKLFMGLKREIEKMFLE